MCKSDVARGMGLALLASVLAATLAVNANAQWPQWGGPDRNFTVQTEGLADSWPATGPRKLWRRELGDGFSAIICDDNVLYTMYRMDEDESTVALDANTGRTLWEHRNASPFTESMTQYGPGPHSTPLVSRDRLFSVGTNAVMHCFDKRTGKVLWKHDLPEEFGVPVPMFGYASSPIAHNNMVILAGDRVRENDRGGYHTGSAEDAKAGIANAGQSVMAFNQETGRVVWKSTDFPVDYASPILISFHGELQLVFVMRKEVVAVNPDNGELLWSLPFEPAPSENIATPLFNGDDLLFFSAAYDSGSRVIRLARRDGKTVPEELWYNRRLRVHQGNAILVGDYVYGSSGDFGATVFASVNVRTGERTWVDRGLKKATCVYGDGKLIALDEDGRLALATVTPHGLTVHSTCELAEHFSWTAPTLVGKTLYVRDRKHIMALDLG